MNSCRTVSHRALRTDTLRSLVLLACISLATAWPAALEAKDPPRLDVVHMRDGSSLKGLVVDPGGNHIRLEIGGGSRVIAKGDVERIEFDEARRATEKLSTDRVEFKDGHTVDGKVRLIEGGAKVQVTLPGRNLQVVYRREQIRRVLWQDELVTSTSVHYSMEMAQRISEALVQLASEDSEAARKAEDLLIQSGVFATPAMEKELEALEAKLREAGSIDDLPAVDRTKLESLRRVQRVNRLKMVVSDDVEEWEPRVYEILGRGTYEQRDALLKALLPSFSESATDLALDIIRDPLEDERIRSVVVDMLRRLQRNRALLRLYNQSSGQLKLVAAIALARNRILLGVPTLIEALSLDTPQLRELAAKSLREYTSQDFRFRSNGTPAARDLAIARWRAWWRDHKVQVENSARVILKDGTRESPQWKQASRLWRLAHEAWQREQYERARRFLIEALAVDPTFVKASVSLAVLDYSHLDRVADAERTLRGLVDRPVATITPNDHFWIRLELANVCRMQGNLEEALGNYAECQLIDPSSISAVMGQADCNWLMATSSKVEGDERSRRLRSALEGFEKAVEMLEKALEGLVALRPEDIPDIDELPFERRVHNRTVLQVRRGYQRDLAHLYLKIARVEVVLGKNEAAVAKLLQGIDYVEVARDDIEDADKLLVDMYIRLALTYESLGQDILAVRQYRHVLLKHDPSNRTCRRGMERLRDKVARKSGERS